MISAAAITSTYTFLSYIGKKINILSFVICVFSFVMVQY